MPTEYCKFVHFIVLTLTLIKIQMVNSDEILTLFGTVKCEEYKGNSSLDITINITLVLSGHEPDILENISKVFRIKIRAEYTSKQEFLFSSLT